MKKQLVPLVSLAALLVLAPRAGAVMLSPGVAGAAQDARPHVAQAVMSATERAALRAAQDPRLVGLRAGAPASMQPLGADQRSELQRAEQRARGLSELRAGDINLSDRDVTLVAIAVLATVLLIILL